MQKKSAQKVICSRCSRVARVNGKSSPEPTFKLSSDGMKMKQLSTKLKFSYKVGLRERQDAHSHLRLSRRSVKEFEQLSRSGISHLYGNLWPEMSRERRVDGGTQAMTFCKDSGSKSVRERDSSWNLWATLSSMEVLGGYSSSCH